MRRLLSLFALSLLCPPAVAAAAPMGAPDGPEPRAATSAKARAAQLGAGDPMLDQQWPLASDAPLGAPAAWTRSTGNGVVVAVIDSGVDVRHPDLVANLWKNPGEVPGNRVDDDGNGFVDDVHGADVIDRDGTPNDGNGHGTHVAGIVAARAGNGIGVAGLAGEARIMGVRVLDDDANGDTGTVAEGLRYAVRMGARIVNLSLSGPAPDDELVEAVVAAREAGILVVAAVGNDGRNLSGFPSYPASLPHENVIGVAATRPDGELSRVSNFGSGADVAAPGESVLSTAMGGRYEWRTGTSMAAPHVAGALALVAAARPDLDARALRETVLGSARDTDLAVASGTLDAAGAMTAAGLAPVQKAKPKKKKKKLSSKARKAAAKRAAARKAAARRAAARKAAARKAAARRAAAARRR